MVVRLVASPLCTVNTLIWASSAGIKSIWWIKVTKQFHVVGRGRHDQGIGLGVRADFHVAEDAGAQQPLPAGIDGQEADHFRPLLAWRVALAGVAGCAAAAPKAPPCWNVAPPVATPMADCKIAATSEASACY